MMRLSLLLIGAGLLAGCGGDGGGGPLTITSVVINGDSTVFLNGTRQLTATAKSGSTTVTNGVTFEWSSADTTRATVSASGLVSGVRLGATDITALAVLNGTPTSVTSSAHAIRVRIASVVVTPATPAALNFVGDTQRFAAEPRDAQGAAVAGRRNHADHRPQERRRQYPRYGGRQSLCAEFRAGPSGSGARRAAPDDGRLVADPGHRLDAVHRLGFRCQ